MDPTRFDDLVRAAAPADGAASTTGGDGSGAGRLRRGAALKTLGAALLGGLLAGRALPQDTEAKPRRRKRKRKEQRKPLPPRPAPPAPSASAGSKLLWATVDRGGSLARGDGAISATRTAEGAYRVSFKRDVKECAHFAQLPYFSAVGEAYPHPSAEEPTSVIVFTYDTSLGSQGRVPANKDFHLMVMC